MYSCINYPLLAFLLRFLNKAYYHSITFLCSDIGTVYFGLIMFKKSPPLFFTCFLFISLISNAETLYDTNDKFRQLEENLPTPNDLALQDQSIGNSVPNMSSKQH